MPEATSSRVTLDHLRAPKVNQVDAEELDEGLAHMLGERVERSLSNFKVSTSFILPSNLNPDASTTRCAIAYLASR
jgi:hypothetical protein